MDSSDLLFKTILDRFLNDKQLTAEYLQYQHKSSCGMPTFLALIFKANNKIH